MVLVPIFSLTCHNCRGWCGLRHTWMPFLSKLQKKLGTNFYSLGWLGCLWVDSNYWLLPWKAAALTTSPIRHPFYKRPRKYFTNSPLLFRCTWTEFRMTANDFLCLVSLIHLILSVMYVLPSLSALLYLTQPNSQSEPFKTKWVLYFDSNF